MNMVSNYSEKFEEYPVKTNWGVIIFHSAVTNENAQNVFCAIFYEMLIIDWKVCKQKLGRFWAIKNFTRAFTRAKTRTRIFARIFLP